MWIMTNRGFISIVAPKPADFKKAKADKLVPARAKITDYLSVRARNADHLKALFPNLTVSTNFGLHRDYPARVFAARSTVSYLISELIAGMSYTNFKDSVKETPYHDALMGVWSTMNSYGRGGFSRKARRAALDRKLSSYDNPGWEREAPDHFEGVKETSLDRFVARRRAAEPETPFGDDDLDFTPRSVAGMPAGR
jgi:hypothetical protein